MAPTQVLHVDDQPGTIDVMDLILQRQDPEYELLRASNGREGLNMLERREVDCIISDYRMPVVDGLAFLRDVQDEHPQVPFIMLTGTANEQIQQKASEAGACAIYRKRNMPTVLEEIEETIRDRVQVQAATS